MHTMELLEQYIKEMGVDVELDEFNLKDVQLKLPALKHKWVGRLIRHKGDLSRFTQNRESTVKILAQEVVDTATYAVNLQTAMKAAEKHQKIKDIDAKIREFKLIVEFLEKSERIFSGMSFDIKNITEIMKLETL
jgi:predicted GIY-YIG superfamily endonuclease